MIKLTSKVESFKFVIGASLAWEKYQNGLTTIWIKGEKQKKFVDEILNISNKNIFTLKDILRNSKKLDGNYGIIIISKNKMTAITDNCNSVPILLGDIQNDGNYIVGSSGSGLQHYDCEYEPQVNQDSILSVAMSGYTLGNDTLFENINILNASSIIELKVGEKPLISEYGIYKPWKAKKSNRSQSKNLLIKELTSMFERLITSADGAPIVVPLSAGLDSRLMVAGLKKFNYKDVRCFSYGLKNNHEARTAQDIAGKLGYEWCFVPYTLAKQRDVYASKRYSEFCESADHLSGIQFEQEFLAIQTLRDTGWLPANAIIVNGQSGDFITGNHIPEQLCTFLLGNVGEKKDNCWLDVILNKHFSLWEALSIYKNKSLISNALLSEFEELKETDISLDTEYSVYEWSEFKNRQCKYVVQNVRTYEYFGHSWRMPLWDRSFMEFWSKTALSEKYEQNLYKEVLLELNWCNVWRDIPVNLKTIRPNWLRVLRLALKVLHAPLGRTRWHKFERRYLSYWMSNICSQAIVPFKDVANNSLGHRSATSWWSAHYLRRKGIKIPILDDRR